MISIAIGAVVNTLNYAVVSVVNLDRSVVTCNGKQVGSSCIKGEVFNANPAEPF